MKAEILKQINETTVWALLLRIKCFGKLIEVNQSKATFVVQKSTGGFQRSFFKRIEFTPLAIEI